MWFSTFVLLFIFIKTGLGNFIKVTLKRVEVDFTFKVNYHEIGETGKPKTISYKLVSRIHQEVGAERQPTDSH